MAIKLITGVPGAGKTLTAIKDIYEQVQKNNNPKLPATEKRPIYSDIDGLNFGNDVYTIDANHDWRECPDGSLIVYDEVHQRWPTSGKGGRSDDQTCRDLDQHRHRGIDFIIITQWPTKVHFEARTNVTEHVHLNRIAGAKYSTLFKWNSAQGSPDDFHAKQSADTQSFIFPKKLFKYYKSATIHTHKFKIPKKLVFFAVLAAIPATLVVKNIASGETFFTNGLSHSTTTQAESPLAAPPVQTVTEIIIPKRQLLAGCIASKTECYCYTDDGQLLDLEFSQCLNILEKPLPFPLTIEKNT